MRHRKLDKHTAFFRFYGELNDFLPKKYRKKSFPYVFGGHSSVKHVIESIGVPHPEIDLILGGGGGGGGGEQRLGGF